APYGFSTTASFVWRSVDHGVSFHLVPGNASPYGKPITCPGGGDSALAVDSKQRLYFADLQGLTDVSSSVSTDFGATWLSTCNAANDAGVDRPWIAAFGNPLSGGALYQTVDQVAQCTTSCGLGQVGNNIVEITRSQDGVTFTPLPAQQIEQDGIVSGIITDSAGGVYISHTGLVDNSGNLISGSDANGNTNAVVVIRFPNGYNQKTATVLPPNLTLCQLQPATCSTNVVYKAPLDPNTGNSTAIVGQDFAPIAIDRSGNLYAVWAQAPVDVATGNVTGSSQIYMAVSTNHGATWGAPVQVSAVTPNLQTNLMPWIAAGDAGRVDIVWYGTPTLGSCPNQPCGPSAITGHWSVMMAQSLNAVVNGQPNPAATFTSTTVSEVSNHYGAICTMGIGCSTGGDRGLLDFLSVVVGKRGEANVVWADAVNQNFAGGTSSALIAFNRQYSGPSLYASIGQVTGPKPLSGSGSGSTDANYDANGSTNPATTNLVVKSTSVSRPDPQHYRFKIKVQDLTSLSVPATLGGTDAVWLVRWEVPDPNGAGHTYFAAMESDGGQTPTFFDGETSTISDTHGKFMTYPGAHTIQGAYTATAPGVITLTVPIADVGGNANATLYSITGLSVTQTTPSSSGTAIFNQIDATQAFDFTP
ncbi:MAG TPA: hypothetical protein VE994_03520, partial [Terriglobales bacterium]|nr:hypothetical protein [Terriglobales bacterium]